MTLTAIDLFAGLGGNTAGASLAGIKVLWAANHNPVAVETHAQNHPDVEHVCQDLHLADWRQVPKYDILMASPCCQGHSDAKGSTKDWSETSRSTAWCVFTAASKHRPKAIMVENVPEFTRWSESDNPDLAGSVFTHWRQLIQGIGPGYWFSHAVVDSAELGVAQHRPRLFMTFLRKDVVRGPINLPAPTGTCHVPFASIKDASNEWTAVATKAATTRTFIERSSSRFHNSEFLVPYYGKTLERGYGRSTDRPLGAVTTKARYALVHRSHRYLRMLTVAEYRRAMGFGEGYALPSTQGEAIKQLGNAVVPQAAAYVLSSIQGALQCT